jgi:hypothetical protein
MDLYDLRPAPYDQDGHPRLESQPQTYTGSGYIARVSAPRSPVARESSWQGLSSAFKDPDIERIIEATKSKIDEDARRLDIDRRTFSTQVRLHLPSINRHTLRRSSPGLIYEAIRLPLIARCSTMKMSIEEAHNIAFTSLLIGARKLRRDLTVEREGSPSLTLTFKNVQPTFGHFIQSRLHYLLSARCDTVLELGVHIPEARMPIAYLGFSSCDRRYLRRAISMVDPTADRTNTIVLTRMYSLPGALPNLMSLAIAKAAGYIRATSSVRYLVSAFNPMLGFSGAVYRASGFTPFAIAPVTYNYDDRGFFASRRQSGDCLTQNLDTPNNILLALGVDRAAKKSLSKVTHLVDITRQSYQESFELQAESIPQCKELLQTQLIDYRKLLEAAWSAETAHPSYMRTFRERPGPRGQCGVASVWLARELRKQYGLEATYCYGRLEVGIPSVGSVDHHCWLELGPESDCQRLVVDLTCDQASGLGRETLCEAYEDLVRSGLVYTAMFRRKLDELDQDRVWPRFLLLKDAVGEVCHDIPRMHDAPLGLDGA